jgi:hypothetical protein
MKKLLLLLLLTTSSIFAQKLTKEELTDKMSDVGCECASTKEITKDNMEMSLGLCILEAMNKYEKDVEKYYGKNVISDDKKMEELGYDIGLKMGTKCPSVFKFMMENSDDSANEEYIEEEPDAMISGKLTEIKAEQFLTFSVKETSGKMNQFILLTDFDNAFLLTDKVLKTNDLLEVYYYELELFDAKLAKFVTYKVVTDIIKK